MPAYDLHFLLSTGTFGRSIRVKSRFPCQQLLSWRLHQGGKQESPNFVFCPRIQRSGALGHVFILDCEMLPCSRNPTTPLLTLICSEKSDVKRIRVISYAKNAQLVVRRFCQAFCAEIPCYADKHSTPQIQCSSFSVASLLQQWPRVSAPLLWQRLPVTHTIALLPIFSLECARQSLR